MAVRAEGADEPVVRALLTPATQSTGPRARTVVPSPIDSVDDDVIDLILDSVDARDFPSLRLANWRWRRLATSARS